MGTSQRRLLLLLSLLLHLNPSLSYSLKNCTVEYSEDSPADVVLSCLSGELVAVPDDIPRDVSSVDLSNNLIGQIHREDFGFLSELRVLLLDGNQIAHVDDGSFMGLAALSTLSMRSNKLTHLTGNLFQGLSNLTTLNVGENSIQSMDGSAFQFLTSLQTVMLDFNQLQQISDIQPILQLPHLQNLSVGRNQFHSFQTKDLPLNMSSSLKVLDVANSELEIFSITTPIFPHLELIDFSCGISPSLKWDIPDKTLLKNITQLYFSYTSLPFKEMQKVLLSLDSLKQLSLKHLGKWLKEGLLDTVCKIPTLKKLDLSYNSFPNISTKLVNCSQLTDLDLSSTFMEEVFPGSLQSMKQLRYLSLQNSKLSKVPDDIRSLSSLSILDLSNNYLTELGCGDFLNMTRLTELNLSFNRIARLESCAFKDLEDLRVLDLSNNLLSTFGGAFTSGLQKLQFLYLSNNFVSVLEKGDFEALASVRHLDVVLDKIHRVKREAFFGMKNLESLNMSLPLEFERNFEEFNKLLQLKSLIVHINIDSSLKRSPSTPEIVSLNLTSLKTFAVICKGDRLTISKDFLSYLQTSMTNLEELKLVSVRVPPMNPSAFQLKCKLKRLTIQQTHITTFHPELFQPIPNLQVLDLSRNKLRSLDFLAQADLPVLSWLKLSENELTVINETVFQSLPALTYLDLLGNPFTCDCSNVGFIQWVISNNQTQVVNAYQYTCSFPLAKHGSKLLDFDVQSCRMDVNFYCFISSTCLVVLTLLTSFIYHFLRWQLTYGFHLFLAFLYDSKKRKQGAPHCYDAFISYNVHDEAWVYREMLPVLEGEQGWRLCLHHRDFQPGTFHHC